MKEEQHDRIFDQLSDQKSNSERNTSYCCDAHNELSHISRTSFTQLVVKLLHFFLLASSWYFFHIFGSNK